MVPNCHQELHQFTLLPAVEKNIYFPTYLSILSRILIGELEYSFKKNKISLAMKKSKHYSIYLLTICISFPWTPCFFNSFMEKLKIHAFIDNICCKGLLLLSIFYYNLLCNFLNLYTVNFVNLFIYGFGFCIILKRVFLLQD